MRNSTVRTPSWPHNCQLCWRQIVSVVIVVCAITAASSKKFRSSPQCSLAVDVAGVTSGGREGLKATCELRTLRSELLQPRHQGSNNSLSAVDHSLHVTSLNLFCSRQVVFESELQPAAFSNFPRLQELSLIACKLKGLPRRTFSGLSQLRRLTINTQHQDWPGAALSVVKDTFTELPRLKALDLSSSEIWHFPDDSFCSLKSLYTLNLTKNRIHRFSDLGITHSCVVQIENLVLSSNEIDEFPSRSLATPHLHSLHLDHNRIARIDDHALRNFFELKELNLAFNKLVAIPANAFNELFQLRSLNLANNSLSSTPPQLFNKLGQLQALNMSQNQLTFSSDNPDPFYGLIRLVLLDLSHNKLSYLGENSFENLYALQTLFLNNNRISHLSDGVFSSLRNLYTLDISNNVLTSLNGHTLKGLTVLTHLVIDFNKIDLIQANAFQNCSSIQKLSFVGNEIRFIPEAIKGLSLLQELDLSYNSIDSFDSSSFMAHDSLIWLSLSHNIVGNITSDMIPSVSNLRYLDISFNQIFGIERGAFDSLSQLEDLNLTHNFLPDINGLVQNMENLKFVNVSHNNIGWIDYFLVPRNLFVLDFSHNKVTEIENHYEITDNLNLKQLFANNNNITAIGAKSIPNGIEIIDFSNNLIDYISSNTFSLKDRIVEIHLEGNRLNFLDETSLRLPSRADDALSAASPVLYLSRNPLKCDCGAQWLSQAARRAAGEELSRSRNHAHTLLPRLGNIADVECYLPGLWEGVPVPLVNVEQHQFLCTYRRHCYPVCHCCEFDACDCEQTCPNHCSCYNDHSWSHNIVDCGGQNLTTVPLGIPMDVTEAFLDGNDMGNLTSHALIGRNNLKTLYLNNSNIFAIQNRTFNGLRNLQVLRLENNFLKVLRGYEFTLLHNLQELDLSFNQITHISNTSFTALRSLEVLRLNNNRITTFPVWNLALNPFLVEVGLYQNRWSCECHFMTNLKAWLESNRIKVMRIDDIVCYHQNSGQIGKSVMSNAQGHCDQYITPAHISSLIAQDYVMFVSIITVIFIVIVCTIFITVVYRHRIKLWAAEQYTKHLFEKSSNYIEDRQKLFDVFITHSSKDSQWVYNVLTPQLETRGYRTCASYRNCSSPTSPMVSQAVSEGISCSQRVLFVVSRALIDSEWCKYEFKATHLEAIDRLSKKHIILLYLEDIPKCELDREFLNITKKSAYILRPRDPRFWERLRRALPSLRHRRRYEASLVNNLSTPLVANSPHIMDVSKYSYHPVKNLTSNPYWETAVSSSEHSTNIEKPDLGAPPWIEISNLSSGNSASSSSTKPAEVDHTYMSVSECDDTNPAHVTDKLISAHNSPLHETPDTILKSPNHTQLTRSFSPSALSNGFGEHGSELQPSSPPLLPLHHQHMVQNRAVHYEEVPNYQIPHNTLHPFKPPYPHPQPSSKTLQHKQSSHPTESHDDPGCINHSRKAVGAVSHNNSPKNMATVDDNKDELYRDCRRGEGASSTHPLLLNQGLDVRNAWIYQTPVNAPSPSGGHTYYV